MAVTQAACTVCLVVIQIGYHHFTKNVSPWLPIIFIILSNDIEVPPGPHFQNCFFSFMNLNSNIKNKFEVLILLRLTIQFLTMT